MPFIDSSRNKINLTDYDYQQDIKNRILMSNLTIFEVDVLLELVNGSLKNSVEQIAEHLVCSEDEVLAALQTLEASKLFSLQGRLIHIHKNIRKYYEHQIQKFDEDFKPNFEFLQGALNKVPIEVLPNWYALPKHSDSIFSSIVDKFFVTPKVYSAYLDTLAFEDSLLSKIMHEVYSASDLKVPSSTIIKKYSISRESFEEYLLLLEYHFVCCLSYNKKGNKWQEVITPFHEWREYCLVEKQKIPEAIVDEKAIKRLSTLPNGTILHSLSSSPFYTPRNIREIERSLKKAAHLGWIYVDDFLKSFSAPINNKETAILRNKGKRWEYQMPSYSSDEMEFIKAVLLERYFEMEYLEMGLHKKKLCFSVTSLGKMST